MFTAMPMPVFRDEGASATTLPPLNLTASSPFRPSISSPLSSSPIRASSPTPPLSPRDPNARRAIQSSPVQRSKFAFATRPTRPNPVAQRREAAQESRRKLFLKNVRQRSEDTRWERRGGEQELLKMEWFSLNKELRQAKNEDLDGVVFESDIEDAARLREEVMSHPLAVSQEPSAAGGHREGNPDADAVIADMFEQELEAMVSSMPSHSADCEQWYPNQQQSSSSKPPDSPHWSDDDDYDALFMDYLSQEQQSQGQSQVPAFSGEMDLS